MHIHNTITVKMDDRLIFASAAIDAPTTTVVPSLFSASNGEGEARKQPTVRKVSLAI